ncbi:GL18754 [Drosophila persimilis]|uniref:GL18754 n=2 Tax=Drosophila persimilis TaxID=7234 RepID=B4G8W6_DROPE|nr:GL18754 [Drosophila persimilis]
MTGLKEQVKEISAVKVHQKAESVHETCPNGPSSGIFQIKIEAIKEPFQVPCVPSSSGWMVIQRRIDGSTDFNRTWNDYKLGFGNLRDNFFLGLEKIHLMTKNQPHELFIQLQDIKGTTSFAHYKDFKIGSEKEAYKLKSVGKYSGTAGDSLTEHHLNMKFSTLDRDNDIDENRYCADDLGGGWWFRDCAHSSLNGKYYADGKSAPSKHDGILWGSWQHYDYTNSLTRTQMMIRPTSYCS